MCILLWLNEVVYRNQSHPVDLGAAEVSYVLTGLLPAGAAHLCEKGVEVSYYNSRVIYFSLQFYQCLPHIV